MAYIQTLTIGLLIALMVWFNGILNQFAGLYGSTLIIHLIGVIGTLVMLFILKEKLGFSESSKGQLKWYLFVGGFIGALTVVFNNIGFMANGVSLTLSLGLFGQMCFSLIADQFGLLGLPKRTIPPLQWLSLCLVLAGTALLSL